MMNAIRMVWVISRHYNTDERMVPLMELIAGEIAGKVHPKPVPSQRKRRSIFIWFSLYLIRRVQFGTFVAQPPFCFASCFVHVLSITLVSGGNDERAFGSGLVWV